MITITQNKVAGFEPRWAPFAGFSVLFDNPGDSLTVDGGLSRVACAPTVGGPLDLYARIDKTLDKLDRDLLIQTYLFCPLPPSSYHVTIWDGINVDNIGSVEPVVRPAWSRFLRELPSSLTAPPPSMAVVTGSTLETWSGSISFQFEKLALWGNQVLVARLRPAERTSEQSLAVMYLGRVVEYAPRRLLFAEPRHPYTRTLLSSVPVPGRKSQRRLELVGEPPNPAAPPPGCHFQPRCYRAEERCRHEYPPLEDKPDGRRVACYFADDSEPPA